MAPPAARKSPRRLRVPVALPAESASHAWLRSIRLSGFSILVLAILVLFLVVLAPGLRTLLEQRSQIAALQAAVDGQRRDVDQLTEQRARWDDPVYIKAQARDRLFYVLPGEYPYLIIDDVPAAEPVAAAPVSAELEATQVDWTATLFSSYLSAGLTDAPADEGVTP
ncbi:MAG: septum formation initiator family protein [Naasia sp.]